MPCLKSPVNRIGGKYFLRHWIIEKMPEHTLYCEPFCGAGHLLFAKTPSEVEIINDIDNHLINFFKVIQKAETRQVLIDRFNYIPYSRTLWREFRERWKHRDIPNDPIEAFVMWFYLNRSAFGGDFEGGFAMPTVGGWNPAQRFRSSIERIESAAERLRNVTIENLSCEDCIQRYDSPDSLFYIDPPYMQVEHYYGDCFNEQDHYKLAELLNSIQGKAMVSHYDNPVYNEFYQGWHRYEFKSFKSLYKVKAGGIRPKTTEVLYCNFEPKQKQITMFENI